MSTFGAISIIVFVVLVFVFLLVSLKCAPAPTEGKIIAKRHTEKTEGFEFAPMYPSDIYTGFVYSIPEQWLITVVDPKGVEGDIYLDKENWEKLNVGGYYVAPKQSNSK